MPNPMGFEPLVNQRLLPPTFPRYTRIKPRSEALQYFNDLISKLKEAMKVTSISSFHSVLVYRCFNYCNYFIEIVFNLRIFPRISSLNSVEVNRVYCPDRLYNFCISAEETVLRWALTCPKLCAKRRGHSSALLL